MRPLELAPSHRFEESHIHLPDCGRVYLFGNIPASSPYKFITHREVLALRSRRQCDIGKGVNRPSSPHTFTEPFLLGCDLPLN